MGGDEGRLMSWWVVTAGSRNTRLVETRVRRRGRDGMKHSDHALIITSSRRHPTAHRITYECGLAGPVNVGPVVDVDDSNGPAAFIDLVDDAVGPDPCRVQPGEFAS